MHLGGIGFGGEALALLPKDLAAEPLELVLERGDLLGLQRNRLCLGTDQGGELRGAHRWALGEGR